MTVKDLKLKLEQMPEELIVRRDDHGVYQVEITSVEHVINRPDGLVYVSIE